WLAVNVRGVSLSLRERDGAERRVRVRECVNLGPHPALSLGSPCRARASPGHLLPRGEGHALRLFANLDNSDGTIIPKRCLLMVALEAAPMRFAQFVFAFFLLQVPQAQAPGSIEGFVLKLGTATPVV